MLGIARLLGDCDTVNVPCCASPQPQSTCVGLTGDSTAQIRSSLKVHEDNGFAPISSADAEPVLAPAAHIAPGRLERVRPAPGTLPRRAANDSSVRSKRRQKEIRVPGFRGVFIVKYPSGRRMYILRYRNPLTGKKTARTLGCAKTMSLPELALVVARIQQQLALGLDPNAATLKFGEYLDREYIPHIRQHLRSHRDHESRINTHLRGPLGHLRIDQINIVLLRQVVANLRRSPTSAQPDAPLAPATVNLVIKLLQAICTFMVERGVLNENPARALKLRKVDNARRRILTGDEVARLGIVLNAEPTLPNRCFLLLLLTGLRIGEVLGIRFSDVDMAAGTLTLHRTKSGRRRVVFLSPEAVAILAQLKAVQRNEYAFPAASGDGPMSYPHKAFTRVIAQAEIADLRPHDFRRSFLSAAIESPGVTVHDASKIAGHSSIAVTQKHYLVANDDRLRTATHLTSKAMSERLCLPGNALGMPSVTAAVGG